MASWMTWAIMASPIQLSLPALEISIVVYTIHFLLDFCFLSHFIVAMFTDLMDCITYCPFYHLATMHVCERDGMY